MTTWISKGALLGVIFGLAACEDGQTVGFLDELTSAMSSRPSALSRTQMAEGAFTLVPPDGFCIDKNTLRRTFALMARCDTLGQPDLAGGAPIGLITISVTELPKGDELPSAEDVARAVKLARISGERSSSNALTFRAEGVPPAAGLDVTHWRGMARVGDKLMGIALFGPEDGRAASSEGRDVINSLIRGTQEANGG